MFNRFNSLTSMLICMIIATGCVATDFNSNLNPLNNNKTVNFVPSIPGIKKVVVLALPKEYAPDRHIENEFIQGLISKKYTVASRYDLPKLIQEQIFQRSSISESEAARIGKILNAHAVLIIEVTELERRRSDKGDYYISRLSMAARLINVETANILWIRSKTKGSSSLVENLAMLPVNILIGANTNKFDSLIEKFLMEFPDSSY